MPTSVFFKITPYVVLEYIYTDPLTPEQHNTNAVKFRKIHNAYDGTDTFVNDNNSVNVTKNVIDNTVVKLIDGNYALMDNDAAYFYPNIDENIVVSDINFNPNLFVSYDTVRIHLLSGYNFEGLEGFIFSLDLRRNDDVQVLLTNYSFLKSEPFNLYFNPKALRFAEFIYDKYIEIKIPAMEYVLNQQEANPNSQTTFSYYLTNGKYLANQHIVYVDFKYINKSYELNGATYFMTDEHVRFSIASADKFSSLTAFIQEATDGDYFQYGAQWNGEMIENFIYQLNSLAGNDYVLFHDIVVTEQIGQSFVETFAFNELQSDNYDILREFVPLLKRSNVATSFSIDYTVRLYNRADGRSIFKTSSLTSTNVSKYGKTKIKLNVGNVTQPIKIFNTLTNYINNGEGDSEPLVQVKYVTQAINALSVVATLGTDISQSAVTGSVTIEIKPFDNIYKFSISDNSNGAIKPLDISGASVFYLNFIKNDTTILKVEEYFGITVNKSMGQVGFKIDQSLAKQISSYTDKTFYVTIVDQDGIETPLLTGLYKIIKN